MKLITNLKKSVEAPQTLKKIPIYALCGMAFASLGWNGGQWLMDSFEWFKLNPEFAVSPLVTPSIAIGIVLTEIFLHTPFHHSWRKFKQIFWKALIPGIIGGLIAEGICQILLINFGFLASPTVLRTIRWVIIALTVGYIEAGCWKDLNIEGGKKGHIKQRRRNNLKAGIVAGLFSALIFEIFRFFLSFSREEIMANFQEEMGFSLVAIEGLFGFLLLGGVLSFGLVFTSSPSYVMALRPGKGTEYNPYEPNKPKLNHQEPVPDAKVNKENSGSYYLDFVSNKSESISYPILVKTNQARGKEELNLSTNKPITIGTHEKYIIRLEDPTLSPDFYLASILVKYQESQYIVNLKIGEKNNQYQYIRINQKPLNNNNKEIVLHHNDVIEFFTSPNNQNSSQYQYTLIYYTNRLIEEGLSIQLPEAGIITIGSEVSNHIILPELSPIVAKIILGNNKSTLIRQQNQQNTTQIQVNNAPVISKKLLEHYDLITFICQTGTKNNEPKIYRFVYYNRFLDPQG
jgi:hypothetical protein